MAGFLFPIFNTNNIIMEIKKPKKGDSIKYVPVKEDGHKDGTIIDATVKTPSADPIHLHNEADIEFKRGDGDNALQERKGIPMNDNKEPGTWHWG
jgi:hypothetical protein